MKPFVRTASGQAALHHFLPGVLVWVEGPSDITVFAWLEERYGCRLRVAGGRPRCEKLIDELLEHNYPYVVLIDGDYDVLDRVRSRHHRAVMLRRHSAENYLFEVTSILRVLRRLCPDCDVDAAHQRLKAFLADLDKQLIHLVVLDVAAVRHDRIRGVLPRNPGRIFPHAQACQISSGELAKLQAAAQARVSQAAAHRAMEEVTQWLHEGRRLVHLLCGHVAFGALRRFVLAECVCAGCRRRVDNESLLAYLSAEVWSPPLAGEHARVRERLRRAIRSAQALAAA